MAAGTFGDIPLNAYSPCFESHPMPRSLMALPRHAQRTKRRAGVFVGMTSYPAAWWPGLLGQATEIVTESGIADRFYAAGWLLDVLRTPSTALRGRTPLSIMDTDEGRAHVEKLLAGLRAEGPA